MGKSKMADDLNVCYNSIMHFGGSYWCYELIEIPESELTTLVK